MKSGSTPTIVATEVPAVRSRPGVDGDATGVHRPPATVCSDLPCAFDPDRSFALTFEALPCMAMIERKGYIVARNRLARRMTGYTDPMADTTDGCNTSPESSQVEHVLIGAYDFRTNERRLRFDCLAMRRHGAPMQVNAASERIVLNGEPCTLLLLMEYAEGFAGATRSEVLLPRRCARRHARGHGHHPRRPRAPLQPGVFPALRLLAGGVCRSGSGRTGRPRRGVCTRPRSSCTPCAPWGRASIETVRKTRSGEAMDVSVLVTRVRLRWRRTWHAWSPTATSASREARRGQAAAQGAARRAHRPGQSRALPRPGSPDLVSSQTASRPPLRRHLPRPRRLQAGKRHAGPRRRRSPARHRRRPAHRLPAPQDTVARFGGDEFALLLDESAHVSEVVGVAERIQVEIQRAIQLEGQRRPRQRQHRHRARHARRTRPRNAS